MECVYAVEKLTAPLMVEIGYLIESYYADTPANTGLPPYDFIWEFYETLDKIDAVLFTTARSDGTLVGVAIYFLVQHPHHRGLLMAECDTIAVDKTCRGQGVGRALYAFTEQRLKERDVQRVTNRYRVCYGTKPVFEELGFKLDEHVYMKEI